MQFIDTIFKGADSLDCRHLVMPYVAQVIGLLLEAGDR
jgi:hypothetical protein